ncbi:DUF5673 domain-containing protein [Clostridium botulinum]|uniref:DUF5673 domain-containing protein n=2 Tax=Clostridium botulinum TaxID=1491 RepID=A0A9Q1ZCA5_CLOBO|nr:DUF5673 domain-containing protein [Clostridium botulinum]AEB76603.1 hypothetical protein CbC4_1931 [Clostridium botulinum BKT015925]KEI02960.1 hypothetical protein Y848_06160 [Clostridium botulinum C/D str. Sp77]KEI04020.1 hypothetical protein Z953_03340 [Clostridium botulinum D str. 16868]KLU76521.1 hypothetical protein CBC3_03370 [Clostridium botulinum V891]KOA76994.1 hypothetical protein ADU78_04800 [Clostridium botulinum]
MTIFLLVTSIFGAYSLISMSNKNKREEKVFLVELKKNMTEDIIRMIVIILLEYFVAKNMFLNSTKVLELSNILFILICIEIIVLLIFKCKIKFGILQDGIYFNGNLYSWNTVKTYKFVGSNRLNIWIKKNESSIIKVKYSINKEEKLKKIIKNNVSIDGDYDF